MKKRKIIHSIGKGKTKLNLSYVCPECDGDGHIKNEVCGFCEGTKWLLTNDGAGIVSLCNEFSLINTLKNHLLKLKE